jgi:2-polyprenyl-3-methyl-5-hydroxy-6-metoxy-1,4-benzoquinol methylase
MQTDLEYIVEQISHKNPLHGKKLKKNLTKVDADYLNRANLFLNKYKLLLQNESKTLDFAIDCYLQMIADVNYESVQFMQTGKYTSQSFEEVNKRVYEDPIIMEYYMHGLLLSQFLLIFRYKILIYFHDIINTHSNKINNYLEVGGGHGLYISEAINILKNKAIYDLVDISHISINIAKKVIANDNVKYICSDVFEYSPNKKYDFITMGEVLEHVENPIKLLQKLYSLLNTNGKVFITTPTNAPAIDHIYLFNNADDIRKIINEAGFKIENELCVYSEDITPEIAEKFKVSMMYAGLLTK